MTSIFIYAACLFTSTAAAQGVSVEVMDPGPYGGVYVVDPSAGMRPPDPIVVDDVPEDGAGPDESGDHPMRSRYGMFFDSADIGRLDLRFDDPEVAGLGGTAIDAGPALRSALAWGVVMATSARPTPWLVLPELRLYFGGASLDAPWAAPEGAPVGIEARAESVLLVRGELAGGVELPLGPVRPFVLGKVAYTGYFISTAVRHEELGRLGDETIDDGVWELGVECGVSIDVSDSVRLDAAWRRSLTGARGDGVIVAVSVGLGPQV